MRVGKITPNDLRLGVCLPLAQGFNLTTNLMGQIAQNHSYVVVLFFIFCAGGVFFLIDFQ
jgi:hypothetical protein